MYEVIDTGLPASHLHHKRGCIRSDSLLILGWDNHEYSNLQEAIEHARDWLGRFASILPTNWDGSRRRYQGGSRFIEIHKCKDKKR